MVGVESRICRWWMLLHGSRARPGRRHVERGGDGAIHELGHPHEGSGLSGYSPDEPGAFLNSSRRSSSRKFIPHYPHYPHYSFLTILSILTIHSSLSSLSSLFIPHYPLSFSSPVPFLTTIRQPLLITSYSSLITKPHLCVYVFLYVFLCVHV